MLNAHERPCYDEVNDKASLTVPDQTMDLREILVRFASGQEISGHNGLAYMEDDEIENTSGRHIDTLDLSEKQQLKEHAKLKIADIYANAANATTSSTKIDSSEEINDVTEVSELSETEGKS